jgi:hypothetical protein
MRQDPVDRVTRNRWIPFRTSSWRGFSRDDAHIGLGKSVFPIGLDRQRQPALAPGQTMSISTDPQNRRSCVEPSALPNLD